MDGGHRKRRGERASSRPVLIVGEELRAEGCDVTGENTLALIYCPVMDADKPSLPAKQEPPLRKRGRGHRRRLIILLLAAVIVLVLAFVFLLRYYVDWLWFGEVALRTVFWRRITIGAIVGPIFALVFFAIMYGNIEIARRGGLKYRLLEGADLIEAARETAARQVRQVGFALSLLVAVIVGFSTAGSWLTFARALNGVPFGVTDPIFHHDLSFYIFTLPAWQYVYTFLFFTLIAALVVTVVARILLGGVQVLPPPVTESKTPASKKPTQAPDAVKMARSALQLARVRVDRGAVSHVSALLGALFIVGGVGYLLKAWNLLYSNAGVVFGAGYTDVHVRLPLIRALMALALLLGAALIYNAVRGRRKLWPPIAIGAWIVALIVLLAIVPAAWQSLSVNPNQLTKETPYIANDIAATRSAYDLTAISETPYSLQGDLSAAQLQANGVTISNIRLWDPEVLMTSYSQLQELRPYYSFASVSVDRYLVNNVYTQTMLAPRELRLSGLPATAQTWVNQHITYTHGYGVTVSAVNQVASGGSPDFLVQDVPLVSSTPALAITEPRIYFGRSGTNYVLVKTKDQEFDYPGPGGDAYTTYTGSGGIPVGSFLNQLAFAVRFSTIKFFTSSAITGDSRVIINDEVKARLAAAAPFLTFDANPYMVVADGKLYWIADAYTTTSRYPYSQPDGTLNYIRNSVKVVIDAYNGTMDFYVFDPSDPLIQTYEKIFPGMFKPASEMPTSLSQHVRYPEDFFTAQARMFATYHVTDPGVLYNKGNQWEIPSNVSASGGAPLSPYYMIMRLPGQTKEEFVLILPYVPNARSNMIAWLAAESDSPNYGKAVSFEFPSSLNVYGPAQVEAAINQDPTISSQRTLWGQQGSTVIFGNLLTVPIGNSLLYVQPLYLQSSQTQLPQIQRIIVFYRSPSATPDLPSGQQQNVVMAQTLGEALTSIFGGTGSQPGSGGTTPPTTTPTTSAVAQLIAQANAEYAAAQAALRAGDLSTFAKDIDALGKILTQLQAATAAGE
jgi:uncharacterized membrane protein (UPF0182 family)